MCLIGSLSKKNIEKKTVFVLNGGAQTPPHKTMQGECRSHACMGVAEPQGLLERLACSTHPSNSK